MDLEKGIALGKVTFAIRFIYLLLQARVSAIQEFRVWKFRQQVGSNQVSTALVK